MLLAAVCCKPVPWCQPSCPPGVCCCYAQLLLQGKASDEIGVPPTDEHVLCDDNRFIADIM